MKNKIGNNGERTTPNEYSTFEFERIYYYVSNKYKDYSKIVLDYGSGSGYGTKILSNYFSKCYGVDVAEDAVNFANLNYHNSKLEYLTLNPSIQPFPNGTFDYIFSFQVFEHVPLNDLETYIKFIYNMLKINGKAIITTPNSFNYFGGFSGNIHHVKEYDIYDLQSIFNKVIPGRFEIYFVEDILSTKVRLKIRKYFKNTFLGRILGGLSGRGIKFLEKHKIISYEQFNIVLKHNFSTLTGSFYIELHKS
jgi:SAM-dependent methyltransferase